jgi:hypothetical protein
VWGHRSLGPGWPRLTEICRLALTNLLTRAGTACADQTSFKLSGRLLFNSALLSPGALPTAQIAFHCRGTQPPTAAGWSQGWRSPTVYGLSRTFPSEGNGSTGSPPEAAGCPLKSSQRYMGSRGGHGSCPPVLLWSRRAMLLRDDVARHPAVSRDLPAPRRSVAQWVRHRRVRDGARRNGRRGKATSSRSIAAQMRRPCSSRRRREAVRSSGRFGPVVEILPLSRLVPSDHGGVAPAAKRWAEACRINFTVSHTTIVIARKAADNERSKITTAAAGDRNSLVVADSESQVGAGHGWSRAGRLSRQPKRHEGHPPGRFVVFTRRSSRIRRVQRRPAGKTTTAKDPPLDYLTAIRPRHKFTPPLWRGRVASWVSRASPRRLDPRSRRRAPAVARAGPDWRRRESSRTPSPPAR